MKKLSLLFTAMMLFVISTTAFTSQFEKTSLIVLSDVQEKVEIPLSDLPDAVSNALSENYAGYIAEKAYKSTNDGVVVYYVDLVKDGESITLKFDAEGNVLE